MQQRQWRRGVQLQLLQAQAGRFPLLVAPEPAQVGGTAAEPRIQVVETAGQLAIQVQHSGKAAVQGRQPRQGHVQLQHVLHPAQRPLRLQAIGRAMGERQFQPVQQLRLPLGIQLGVGAHAAGQGLAGHLAVHQFQGHIGLLARPLQAAVQRPVGPQGTLPPGRVHRQVGRQPLGQIQPAQCAAQFQVERCPHRGLAGHGDHTFTQGSTPLGQFQPVIVEGTGQPELRVGRQLLQIGRQQRAHPFGPLVQIHPELLAIHLHRATEGRLRQALPEWRQVQAGQFQVALQAGQGDAGHGHVLFGPGLQTALDAGLALVRQDERPGRGAGSGPGNHRFPGFRPGHGIPCRRGSGRGCTGLCRTHLCWAGDRMRGAHRQADGQILQGDVQLRPLLGGRQAETQPRAQVAQRNAVGSQRAGPAVARLDVPLPVFGLALDRIDVEVEVDAGFGQGPQRGEAQQVDVGQPQVQVLHRHPAQWPHHGVDIGQTIGQRAVQHGRQAGKVAIHGEFGVVRPLLGIAIGLHLTLQGMRGRRLHLHGGRFHIPPRRAAGQRTDAVGTQFVIGPAVDVLQQDIGFGILAVLCMRLDLQPLHRHLADFQRHGQAEIAGHVGVGTRGVITGRQLDDQRVQRQQVHIAPAGQQAAQRPAQIQVRALDHGIEAAPFHPAQMHTATPQVALYPVEGQHLALASQQPLRPRQGRAHAAFGTQPHQGGQQDQQKHQQQPDEPPEDPPPQRMADRRLPAAASAATTPGSDPAALLRAHVACRPVAVLQAFAQQRLGCGVLRGSTMVWSRRQRCVSVVHVRR